MIYFVGNSFAANHLRAAAEKRGLLLACSIQAADLVFISQDTPIKPDGHRDLVTVRALLHDTLMKSKNGTVFILTSQVPPGFTRNLGWKVPLYHQAETLRVRDAEERAMNPEQIIVGCEHPREILPKCYLGYLAVFNCLVFQVTWEEAEFSKIAINMTLASQVENTNRLAETAKKVGANWKRIANILRHDRRIGPYSYLEPGDWRKSKHLLRDHMTLKEIENADITSILSS